MDGDFAGIQKLMAYFGSGIFLLVGLIILASVINDIIRTKSQLKLMTNTVGTVLSTGSRMVETGSGPNRNRSIVKYAEIEYSTQKGNQYVFEHSYGLIQGPFKKGDKVKVCYYPEDDSQAMVNTFRAVWLLRLSMLLLPLAFIGAGILIYKVVMPK